MNEINPNRRNSNSSNNSNLSKISALSMISQISKVFQDKLSSAKSRVSGNLMQPSSLEDIEESKNSYL